MRPPKRSSSLLGYILSSLSIIEIMVVYAISLVRFIVSSFSIIRLCNHSAKRWFVITLKLFNKLNQGEVGWVLCYRAHYFVHGIRAHGLEFGLLNFLGFQNIFRLWFKIGGFSKSKRFSFDFTIYYSILVVLVFSDP